MEINSREKEESYEIRNLKLGCIMHGLWKRQWDYSKHLNFLCSGHSIPVERVKEMGLVGHVGKTDKFLGLEYLPEIMKLQWTRVCCESLFLKLGLLISDWLMWAHLEMIKLGGGWKREDCEDWEWQILVLKRMYNRSHLFLSLLKFCGILSTNHMWWDLYVVSISAPNRSQFMAVWCSWGTGDLMTVTTTYLNLLLLHRISFYLHVDVVLVLHL